MKGARRRGGFGDGHPYSDGVELVRPGSDCIGKRLGGFGHRG